MQLFKGGMDLVLINPYFGQVSYRNGHDIGLEKNQKSDNEP